ncbi:DUF3304 domain-containing protein [Pseudomonas guariconensis]|uniref:DUF3304 domain-containing protein n=1 Tax=Pseudomonas TaxID=286 RepID=UPI0020977FA0|nr:MULTISPECIES: DUF3304 domain-containing protein [Pseudomonas]MCO7643015.1 DUF3304 domain-containing protein [Pseudomonas sp. S 311-6]MCO7517570.1 DUF3304 domain-containing protein [Pseudomonas putida]MCO7567652.1 DUF3304 domain-containing protein [Pseudomonas mosselii]MCO7608026.1 DUF3304 domain-containing protein [Pseudomonas guariconensis]MCO7619043.1 DUF3304 domain-containing protein [Pseudomonas guariconensis]
MHWFCGMLGLALAGCSTADNESSAGNISAVNHVDGTAVNWFSVNGYRASGGGGEQCCIILPDKWRPGLKATIKWEVDTDPYAYSKWPSLGTDGYRVEQAKHAANYKHYSTTVEIPEWQGNERCGLTVHFLPCQQVKVTTSCWASYSPNYPIQDPRHVKEPAVCTK